MVEADEQAAESPPDAFDLEGHAYTAATAYEHIRPLYEDFATDLRDILVDAIDAQNLKSASIEKRAKTVDSFRQKAAEPSDEEPGKPKYPNPLDDITDLAGVRIITFFPKDLGTVDSIIKRELVVLERDDKSEPLISAQRFGYQSIHYLVQLKSNRTILPEYARFRGTVAEIQVRTILQHAWAEIEHDIQYKSLETMPMAIRRRFMSLAGMLEIADREFQGIQDQDEEMKRTARESLNTGELENVEITPDAVKAYLDKRLGPDRRMSLWSYDYAARLLQRLGFTDFRQVDECIGPYDDDRISRIAWGARQGQVLRFQTQLLAAFGQGYLEGNSHWDEWLREYWAKRLELLVDGGVEVGTYDPSRLRPIMSSPR